MTDNLTNPSNSDDSKKGRETLEQIVKQVQEDQAALQAEFNIPQDPNSEDATQPDTIRKALVAAAPRAIQEIISLSTMAESESVRANTCKYILDVAIGKVQIGDPTADGLNKLLEDLMGNRGKKADKAATDN